MCSSPQTPSEEAALQLQSRRDDTSQSTPYDGVLSIRYYLCLRFMALETVGATAFRKLAEASTILLNSSVDCCFRVSEVVRPSRRVGRVRIDGAFLFFPFESRPVWANITGMTAS